MNQAVLLFPGERLPYHVVDYALDWATENEGSLKVVFVLPSEAAQSEGYPFPNDLDQAESLRHGFDVEEGLRQILKQETRYIQKRASARHVPVDFVVLHSPSFDKLNDEIRNGEMLFVDKNVEDDPELFRDLEFSMDDVREVAGRLFPVGEHDRYSDVFY